MELLLSAYSDIDRQTSLPLNELGDEVSFLQLMLDELFVAQTSDDGACWLIVSYDVSSMYACLRTMVSDSY
jgi:hypothetical protein